MQIDVTCRNANARKYERALRTDAASLLRILELERGELSLMIVGDRAIRRLNRDLRAKDQATDVLSFPQLEERGEVSARTRVGTKNAPPFALGDVVISIDTASRQARELDQSIAARIRTLLIHGLLHLLGYDHERSPAEARRMFAREHELAARMPSALMDEARAKASHSRLDKTQSPTIAKSAKAGDLRWSPAAMPQASTKREAKSVGKHASKAAESLAKSMPKVKAKNSLP
jgi:probable rRNA maturation factor